MMRRIKYVVLSFILLLPCALFFGCREKYIETAICKIGEVEYAGLADAICSSVDGDTIKVYNDCIESLDNLTESGNSFNIINEKVYTNYKIDKNIFIEGVGPRKPKVYGNFMLELNDRYNSYDKITISGLEIQHAEMQGNSGFNYGILVVDGSANITDNNVSFVGESINKNTYGVVVTRKNGNFEHSQNARKLSYDISGNRFGDYQSKHEEAFGSSVAVFENGDQYGAMKENVFNNSSQLLEKTILKENSFSGGNIVYHYDFFTKKINGFVTSLNHNMQVRVIDDGILIFSGNLNFPVKTEINLYCETIVNGWVKNVDFFAKTMKAKLKYEKENSVNVTYNPITEII